MRGGARDRGVLTNLPAPSSGLNSLPERPQRTDSTTRAWSARLQDTPVCVWDSESTHGHCTHHVRTMDGGKELAPSLYQRY